jgi:hypothetical protein
MGPSTASTSSSTPSTIDSTRQHPVDHRQHPLHLAAEVRVPGGIDDIDVRALVAHRAVLGEDGDAALALQVVRIHDPFLHVLVRREGARLLQQLVDQRGLAVVDVRDDGDVPPGSGHELDSKIKKARHCTRVIG